MDDARDLGWEDAGVVNERYVLVDGFVEILDIVRWQVPECERSRSKS